MSETKSVKPSKEILEKLKGFSVARGIITIKVQESELGEFAPVVQVKALTNVDIAKIAEANESGSTLESQKTIERLVKEKIVSIKIYDITTEKFEEIKAGTEGLNEEDYGVLPQATIMHIVEYIFSLCGISK